jgi:hypothetical protein
MERGPFNAIEVANWLKKRRENGLSNVLFLGARAGGLFRSKTLYSTSQYFSPRTFHNMIQTQQFGECYRVLCEGDFVRGDIHSILVAALQSLKIAPADSYLANLVQSGIFDLIISTNIDNLLPTAFAEAGMKEGEDFKVVIPQQHAPDEVVSREYKHLCTLIKIAGDLEIGEYNLFRQNFYLETHDKLKTFLASILSEAMIMLGYDPFWDRAIDAVLPLVGQEFWYVNEEESRSPLSTILQQRKGRYIVGGEGSYEAFMQKLYWYLGEEKSQRESLLQNPWKNQINPFYQTSETQNVASVTTQLNNYQAQVSGELQSEKEQRTCVFIGYSRKDRGYLEKLKAHMALYEREKLLNVWDDQKVKPGMIYRDELQAALNITKIAILLVSPDFIASDFIASDILPPLLQMAEKRGAVILPVIIKPCVIEGTELRHFQPFNDPSKPLSAKNSNGRDMVWADLVRYVVTLGRDIKHV